MHLKIVAIVLLQSMLAAGGASAQADADPATAQADPAPAGPGPATAAPVCAGDCCVINDELVCTKHPEVPPGTNPVVIVPPQTLRDWLRTHDPAQINDYLNGTSGEVNG